MDLKYFTKWSRLHRNCLVNSVLFIFLSLCILIEETWTLPSGESGENDSNQHRIQNFTRGHSSQQRRKRGSPDDFLGRISSERIIAIGADPGSEDGSDESCCFLSKTEEKKCDMICDSPQTQICSCDFHFPGETCSWECIDDPPDPPEERSQEDKRKKRSPHIRHHSKSRSRHNKHHRRSSYKHH